MRIPLVLAPASDWEPKLTLRARRNFAEDVLDPADTQMSGGTIDRSDDLKLLFQVLPKTARGTPADRVLRN